MTQAALASGTEAGSDPVRRLAAIGFGLGLALVAASAAITFGGRAIGERIALSGHSEDPSPVLVDLGPDRLALPANAIRFSRQRVAGPAERVDLTLSWPGLDGYSAARRAVFNDAETPGRLIFVTLSQSVMSRDMSGRVEPIYSHLFDGAPEPYRHGLTLNHLSATAGYRDEVLLTAPVAGEPAYAVRCILPEKLDLSTNADCQRDIAVGRDLSVEYRFSATLLGDWKTIDASVRSFIRDRLVPNPTSQKAGDAIQMRGNTGSTHSS